MMELISVASLLALMPEDLSLVESVEISLWSINSWGIFSDVWQPCVLCCEWLTCRSFVP